MSTIPYPHGYTVIPLPPPTRIVWRVVVRPKTSQPPVTTIKRTFQRSEVIVQLTADQQVDLTIEGQDKYGNPVDLTGDVLWVSSDESVVAVVNSSPTGATAQAVGPVGTASVTVSNDVNQDGTGDFQGSIAIDVVAGEVAEIEVTAGDPYDKS